MKENKARDLALKNYSLGNFSDREKEIFKSGYDSRDKEVEELKKLIVRASFLFNDNLENVIITSESRKWLSDMELLK